MGSKFGGHRHSGSRNIMVLVCDLVRPRGQRVIWPDEKELIKVSYWSAKLGGHMNCGNEDIMVFVCHMVSRDHVIKAYCEFMGGCSSW